ncbi:MAG: PaaI family thioesterase, partial [Promethearchaeota archaeon]
MPKKFPTVSKGFNPFCDLIGLNFTEFRKGYTQCTLNLTNDLLNPHKTVHGAVLYAMADTGMGGALYSLLEEEELCATIEIKITYFKAV